MVNGRHAIQGSLLSLGHATLSVRPRRKLLCGRLKGNLITETQALDATLSMRRRQNRVVAKGTGTIEQRVQTKVNLRVSRSNSNVEQIVHAPDRQQNRLRHMLLGDRIHRNGLQRMDTTKPLMVGRLVTSLRNGCTSRRAVFIFTHLLRFCGDVVVVGLQDLYESMTLASMRLRLLRLQTPQPQRPYF